MIIVPRSCSNRFAIESVGTLPPAGDFICRLPIYQGERQIMRNYCAFWRKEQANYYIEEFADTLKKLLEKQKTDNRKVSPAELLHFGSVSIPPGILFSFYICSLNASRLPHKQNLSETKEIQIERQYPKP